MDYNIPLYVLLVSYPEKFDKLVRNEPTFGRIFHYESIPKLSDDEVKNFFTYAFEKVGITCEEEALDIMTYFSNGIPLMMQQIGDSIFWLNKNINSVITEELAEKGIIDVANQIASKQIRSVLVQIEEEKYRDMLIKITRFNSEFTKSELKTYLNSYEKLLYDDFF